MTTPERDAARLLEAALQATNGITFISSAAQVFIGDRIKTAQALLATSISAAGRRALVHVTSARNHVEAIEVPRLRQYLGMALRALGVEPQGLSLSGLGEDPGVPAVIVPVAPAPAPVVVSPSAPPVMRGMGFIALALAIALGVLLYRGRK